MASYQHLRCDAIDAISTLPALQSMAQGDSLTIELPSAPPAVDMAAVLETLRQQLPDHRVEEGAPTPAGLPRIVIMRVIRREQVLAHRNAFLEAMYAFRIQAQMLMERLAHHLEIPVAAFEGSIFTARWVREGRPRERLAGTLDEEWHYAFHGGHCRFTNARTGQDIEVAYGSPDAFGVLDPYFFFKFLSTTPAYQHLAQIFVHPYHDPLYAFEVLTELGDLRRLGVNSFLPVVPPQPPQQLRANQ